MADSLRDKEHALELIEQIVAEAACPVCLLAKRPSREFLSEAARRGVFAHLDSTDGTELAGGIDSLPVVSSLPSITSRPAARLPRRDVRQPARRRAARPAARPARRRGGLG